MTDATAPAYRPSPRPRPAGAPVRPVDDRRLRVVPTTAPACDNPSELPSSGTPAEAPAVIVSAGQSGSPTAKTSENAWTGFRTRTTRAWTASKAYWAPPAVFTQRPASLADLATYARQAPWTADSHGPIRAFGLWYYRCVAYPHTVASRYTEWFVQRPLRFAALLGGLKIASLTGPGSWAVDNIVYPAVQLAGHVFL